MFRKKANNCIVILPHAAVSEAWHRCFIGLLTGVLIMTAVTLLAGCCEHRDICYEETLAWNDYPAISPKLLFRSPSESSVDPQQFAYRSDWPSIEGDVDLGRVTTYQDYWYNRQSLAPCVPDYSYNLFQSYRTGVKVR